MQATPVDAQQQSRDGGTDRVRYGNGSHEAGHCLGAVLIDEPVGEIHDNPGEKSRFRQSQQKPYRVELMRRTDKGHPDRDDPPRDHDARNPAPCAPSLDDERAWNLQNDVAESEDARPESDDAIVEAEIVRHLQGRSGKIVAIEVSNYIKQEHIRQKTQGNPTASAAGNGIGDYG